MCKYFLPAKSRLTRSISRSLDAHVLIARSAFGFACAYGDRVF